MLILAADFTVLIKGETEFLDGCDDDLVGVVVGQQATDERGGVGVFLDAVFLKAVKFLAGLAVEVLAVNDEEALVDVLVGFEQGRGLEGGERLARAGGVPYIAVAAVLVDAVDDGLYRVDLVRAHHQEFLLACDEYHVLADHVRECAFGEKLVGEIVQMGDFGVVPARKLVDRQKLLVGVKREVFCVVVGEIQRVGLIADDEELDEAQQRFGVAVAGIVLVFDDLLHRPPGADAEGFEFNLGHGDAVDQEDDVVAVVAVIGVDAELVDDFKCVLAPVLDVDESIVEGGIVVAGEGFAIAEGTSSFVHIRGDNLIEKPLELAVGQRDAVEYFEFLPEVLLKRCAVADIGTVFVLKVPQLGEKCFFEVPFALGFLQHSSCSRLAFGRRRVGLG